MSRAVVLQGGSTIYCIPNWDYTLKTKYRIQCYFHSLICVERGKKCRKNNMPGDTLIIQFYLSRCVRFIRVFWPNLWESNAVIVSEAKQGSEDVKITHWEEIKTCDKRLAEDVGQIWWAEGEEVTTCLLEILTLDYEKYKGTLSTRKAGASSALFLFCSWSFLSLFFVLNDIYLGAFLDAIYVHWSEYVEDLCLGSFFPAMKK